MVEETILSSPIVLAIAGGLLHGSVYGGKAYIDGETFDPIKYALTVMLAGLIGLAFYIVGFDPSLSDWFIVLFAYAGLVAELEAILKLLVRGQVNEARSRLQRASDEAHEGTETIARSETGGRMADSARSLLGGSVPDNNENEVDEAWEDSYEAIHAAADEPEDPPEMRDQQSTDQQDQAQDHGRDVIDDGTSP
jgi:hypothetical protein